MKKHAQREQQHPTLLEVPENPKPHNPLKTAMELLRVEKLVRRFCKAVDTLSRKAQQLKGKLAHELRSAGEAVHKKVEQLLLPFYGEQGLFSFMTKWVVQVP